MSVAVRGPHHALLIAAQVAATPPPSLASSQAHCRVLLWQAVLQLRRQHTQLLSARALTCRTLSSDQASRASASRHTRWSSWSSSLSFRRDSATST